MTKATRPYHPRQNCEPQWVLGFQPQVGDEVMYCGTWRHVREVVGDTLILAEGGVMWFQVKERSDE
jgi:hypothetical protein